MNQCKDPDSLMRSTKVIALACSPSCAKACCRLIKSEINAEDKSLDSSKRTRYWSEDGPNSTISSLSVLVDWLTKEPNYALFCGSKDEGASLADGGKTKLDYCKDRKRVDDRNRGGGRKL